MIRVLPVVALLVAFSSSPSWAQLTPPAGSAGAGNSSISGIPAGPANNPTLYDPSGIGNASRTPSLPSQAAIPKPPESPGFGSSVYTPRRGARAPSVRVLRQTQVREERSTRSNRARGKASARERKIDGKFSICRGC